MPLALLSVSDKTGIVELARGLAALGWDLVSTGGTARALRDAGLAPRDVSDITGVEEMLDGRVKTLHPAVHGGLLARRDLPEHLRQTAEHGIPLIDLVAVNLYPFRATAARQGVSPDDVIEQIDIGGPSMLRSAAKNFQSVTVVVEPRDYPRVLATLQAQDDDLDLRRELAEKAFAHTASYDAAIASWFQAQQSRDISDYAYHRGAASLLDFLDAERSYRSVQLGYRQALASYLLAIEQLREAVGTRSLP